jgi:proline iminopeptidase
MVERWGVPRAPVDDTTLWYREIGRGPRCLVMHGGLGIDHHAYAPDLDPLTDALRLVYYDHRCHGASGDAPLETLTLPRLADDADELRQHLGDERIGLLGHSFGGYIAFEYATRHSERVAFLIVVCSSPAFDFGDELRDAVEARLTDDMRDVLALSPPETSGEWQRRNRVLLPMFFHRFDPAFAAALVDPVSPRYDAAIAGGSSLRGWDRWRELPSIVVPTLLVVGDDDLAPHLDRAQRAVEVMPDATLLVIEDCGHYPWLEQPSRLFDGVRHWLRSRGLSGAR